MRSWWLFALLVAPALAGCLDSDGADQVAAGDDLVAPSSDAVAAAGPFALLLCTDGYHLATTALDGTLDRCNHRVTRPLQDGSRLDVVSQHGPANEVSIAVNPLDPLNAAGGGKDYTVSYVSDHAECGDFTVWMGTYHSQDGGLTWDNDLMPGFPGDERTSPLSGNDCNTDPVLVFDDDGTLWYSGLNYGGARSDTTTVADPFGNSDAVSGSQLYFARSGDGGASYPGDAIFFAGAGDNNAIFNDKQWFALQPGGDHMIVTWSQFLPAAEPGTPVGAGNDIIVFSESLDAGRTWSPAAPLRPGTDAGGASGTTGVPAAAQFSMPQYLAGNTLAVIWWDGPSVLYAEGTVTAGGTQWGPVQSTFPVNALKAGANRDGTGPSQFRLSTYPVLAVDASSGPCAGTRYVIWSDQEGAVDSDVEVLLRSSPDGLAWSAPVRVSSSSAGDQLMPWLDVDPDGGVHAVWYDRRGDAENRLLDVYYGYSADCGATWRDMRVSETMFDGDLGHHQSGAPFIGDYIGLDTTNQSAHLLWADTRHTGEAGRAAGSDVYAATILKDLRARATFDAAYS